MRNRYEPITVALVHVEAAWCHQTSSMRDASRDAVEESLGVLEARDVVYFDTGSLAWRCGIPIKATIRLRMGAVAFMVMRSADGVLVCAHERGGTAYVPQSENVAVDAEGSFIDTSLLPPAIKPFGDDRDDHEDEDGAIKKTAIVARGTRLKNVDLRGCFLTHDDMVRVCRGLAGNCFVTQLTLSGNQLQDSSISLLADALLHNGCLQELILSYNEISALGSTLLAAALSDHSRLRILDLMHNRVGPDGILPWLGRTLRSNSILRELRLTHNDIGDRKGTELVSALASKPSSEEEQLKTAIARRRTVATAAPTAAAAAAIPPSIVAAGYGTIGISSPTAEDMPHNTTLATLLLGNTGISDDAARRLRHVLVENRTLTHLDISANRFSSTGHQSIAAGLSGNRALRYLNYNENRIESEGMGAVVIGSLRLHPTIETALFQDCIRGSASASAVAALLRSCKSLKTLDVSHCQLEPPGVVEFYRAIGENATLVNLEMTCMGIKSDQAVAILSKSLEANRALRFLNLSYNEITLRGCKLLRDSAAVHGARLLMSLEGNSGEKKHPGVQITGGSRPVRPPILNT